MMDIQDAILLERQIKNWSEQKKKALISEDRDTLHLLARCKNSSHSNNFSLDSARDNEDD